MLKRRARQGDRELSSLLQDKGLDPNFDMIQKEKKFRVRFNYIGIIIKQIWSESLAMKELAMTSKPSKVQNWLYLDWI